MSERESLKGVPLRLGKSFYPIARPLFRDIDIHIPIDALQEEYDFGLERDVINSFQSYHEEKERLGLELKEKLKRKEEETAKATAIEKERREAEEAAKREEEKKLITQGYPPAFHNRPFQRVETQPLQPHYSRSNDGVVFSDSLVCKTSSSEKIKTWVKSPPLNLSDFESDTANPFDSAEINSINDKAELASIWANHLDLNAATPTSVPRGDSKYHHGHGNGQVNGTNSAPTTTSHQLYYPQSLEPTSHPSWHHPHQWNSNEIPYQPISSSSSSTNLPGPSTNVLTSASSTTIPLPQHNTTTTGVSTLNQTPASNVNSFTKIHFPFLTSYTQTSRAAERSSYRQQQLNMIPHPMQQFPSTSIDMHQMPLTSPNNIIPSQNYGPWPVTSAHNFPKNT